MSNKSSPIQKELPSSVSDQLSLRLGDHRWVRLLVLVLVLYVALLPLWWYSLDAITLATATCADWIYGLIDSAVSISPDGKTASVVVTAGAQSGFGGQTHSSALSMSTVTYGLPMLVALLVATRADSIRAKLRALAIGIGTMLVGTVPVVMFWAKLTSLELDDQISAATMIRSGNRSSFFYYGFHGYAFSQPVIAVGVWLALIMLGLLRGGRRRPAAEAATDPSALCPCGSGRKYKRCCGRERRAQ